MDVFVDMVHIDFGKVGETSRIAERAHKVVQQKRKVPSILFVLLLQCEIEI